MWAMSCFKPLRYLNPFMGHPDHAYEAAGQAAPGARKLYVLVLCCASHTACPSCELEAYVHDLRF